MGVYDGALTGTLARVLGALGCEGAYVVHGADGLDELSVTGVNKVSYLRKGQVSTFELDPQELGIPYARLEDLAGGDPAQNAGITRAVLSGEDRGPRRDVVALNAAAVLGVQDNDWQGGLAQAYESIDNGAALEALDCWVAKTKGYAP
jgi:anthranilate phosphoribosyltransferase